MPPIFSLRLRDRRQSPFHKPLPFPPTGQHRRQCHLVAVQAGSKHPVGHCSRHCACAPPRARRITCLRRARVLPDYAEFCWPPHARPRVLLPLQSTRGQAPSRHHPIFRRLPVPLFPTVAMPRSVLFPRHYRPPKNCALHLGRRQFFRHSSAMYADRPMFLLHRSAAPASATRPRHWSDNRLLPPRAPKPRDVMSGAFQAVIWCCAIARARARPRQCRQTGRASDAGWRRRSVPDFRSAREFPPKRCRAGQADPR